MSQKSWLAAIVAGYSWLMGAEHNGGIPGPSLESKTTGGVMRRTRFSLA